MKQEHEERLMVDIPFPECAKKCQVIERLGAGECESICPHKFEMNEDWSCFTCGYRGPEHKNGACPECGTASGEGFGMAENEAK